MITIFNKTNIFLFIFAEIYLNKKMKNENNIHNSN